MCFRGKRRINLRSQAILGLWRKLNLLPVDKHDGRPIYAERSTAILVGGNALCHLIAIHIFRESLEIESEVGGARIEKRADSLRPDPIGVL